jgi:hypothetical protein
MTTPFSRALCTALIVGGCSSHAAKTEAKRATPAPIPACTLLTTDEAAAALHLSATKARAAPDSVAQAAQGKSTCVFAPTQGIGDVVTVLTETGLPAMDAATLATDVSDTAFGLSAQPVEGFGVPAALSTDPPVVALQKSTVRIVVSAPSVEASKDLATKALARLP